MANPHDYTVGWICAIRTEYVAARAFLEEKHDRPEYVSPNDDNVYTLGKVGEHNVVIASFPDGEYGIAVAASVARDLLHSFPNVRFCLMVGIGGGAPNYKHDIRLGDVIVSTPRYGKGGVFQYDFGKTIQDQTFHTTGFLNQPPRLLRAAVNDLRAQYDEYGHHLEDTINTILEQTPRLQKDYKRPAQSSDRLYQSKFVHPIDNLSSCSASCGDNQSSLVLRPERTRDDDNPAIHYGLIASASQLMKDALVRDKLSIENDVLCFEMEAAGLMNCFPSLVIRGVCDYADTHKNKEWQGYAAMVAAAYAKDLLRRIPPSKIEAQNRIIDVSGVVKQVDELFRLQNDQEHQRILDWLIPTDYVSQQNDYLNRRQLGTGKWFLESVQYQEWLKTEGRTLFCPGLPGAGKTILTSIVVEYLQTDFKKAFNDKSEMGFNKGEANIGIAYLYCSFQRQQEQKIEDLLAILLMQLSKTRSPFPETVEALYKSHSGRRTRPTTDEISLTLQSVATMYSRVFIVIDALDECQVSDRCRDNLLLEVFKLQAKARANVFITSRIIPDIMKEFKQYPSLEIRANDEDVMRFLDGYMPHLQQPCVRNNYKLQELIKINITKAVDGMFLLARLYLDSLIDQTTQNKITHRLNTLPKGPDALNKAYMEAIKRIRSQRKGFRDVAENVLLWVTCARRLLTTSELRHALAVKPNRPCLDENDLEDANLIVSLCAGLVTIDEESDIIRVVHDTAREYLRAHVYCLIPESEEDPAVLDSQKNLIATAVAHSSITIACVNYLSFDVFKTPHCHTDAEFKERLQLYPFYGYAAQNWGHHARGTSTETEKVTLDLLRSHDMISAAGQAVLACRDYAGQHLEAKDKMMGVHHAAYFGLQKAIVALLHEEYYVDLRDAFGWTPLSWAARNGYELVVRLLIKREDVDPDSMDDNGRTPLSWAAAAGHVAVVDLLLAKRGINPDSVDCKGQTPLSWAAENGHALVVELLLCSSRVDVNSVDVEFQQTPLLWAAENGHRDVVKQLLEATDIRLNYKNTGDETALWLALENGHSAIVELLLERDDIDLNSRKNCQTPLWWAAENGYEVMVKLLLDQGAHTKAAKEEFSQVLWLAAENGQEAIVKLLVSRSDDTETTKKDSRTPLWWAAEMGREAIIKLLLESGADVNCKDDYGRAALSRAAEVGRESVVKLLLKKGAYIDSEDNNGRTALSRAAELGREAVVKLLLDKGADVMSRDNYGRTVLSRPAERGHEAVVRLLLKNGADIDSEDNNGQTALSQAAETGRGAIVRLLLDEGAKLESKDKYGMTPLWIATERGHDAVVKLLLAREAYLSVLSEYQRPDDSIPGR